MMILLKQLKWKYQYLKVERLLLFFTQVTAVGFSIGLSVGLNVGLSVGLNVVLGKVGKVKSPCVIWAGTKRFTY
jgi:hypothetical protein